MGKRKQLERQQQYEEEEKEQLDEPHLEDDEQTLKAERKKMKKEKKRAAEEAKTEEPREENEEETAEAEDEQRTEETSEKKKKKKKRDKKLKQEQLESTGDAAVTEERADASDSTVQSEQTSADDEQFDLSSLKRANKHSALSSTAASSSSASSVAPAVESSSRIFIGNLPFKITDDLLHSTFSPCGAIDGVHWVTDKTTGKFYGSAFIDFQSPTAIPAALQLNNTELLGRPMKVGLATGRQSAGQNRFNQKQKNGGHLALHPISDKPDGTTTVFLGNLSFDIDEATVTQLFKDCGEVKQVRWVEKDGVFKGCGFVEFHETDATDLAVKFNGREVLGRPMRVDYSGNTNRGE